MWYSEFVVQNSGKNRCWHDSLKLMYKNKSTGSVLGSTTEKVVTSNDLCTSYHGRHCDPILRLLMSNMGSVSFSHS